MKKLQNNFTTPEQSKRLLELGVPADSADCCLRRVLTDGGYCETWIVDVFDFIGQIHDDYLPCWSVGRLIEIYNITCDRFPGMGLQLGFIPSGLQTFTDYITQKFEYAKEDSLAYFEALNVED